jgi:hypothetical protein
MRVAAVTREDIDGPKSGNSRTLTRVRARPETGNNLLDAVIGGGRPITAEHDAEVALRKAGKRS